MTQPGAPARPLTDAIVVAVICFGWFIVGSVGAVASGFSSGAFDDASFLALIVYEAMLGAVALAFLHYRGHDLATLLPRPTGVGCLIGLALYFASAFAAWPIVALVSSRGMDGEPIGQMVAAATISLPWLIAVSVVNGLYEETFLTGYLLPAFGAVSAPFAIGGTALIRALYHLYQGPAGVVAVLAFGIVCSLYYWHTRKLWPVVFAHMFADLYGFAVR